MVILLVAQDKGIKTVEPESWRLSRFGGAVGVHWRSMRENSKTNTGIVGFRVHSLAC